MTFHQIAYSYTISILLHINIYIYILYLHHIDNIRFNTSRSLGKGGREDGRDLAKGSPNAGTGDGVFGWACGTGGDFMGFTQPGYVKIVMENHHRNSGFLHSKW